MIAYEKQFCKTLYCDGREFYRWLLAADYASGKNSLGGGGIGIGYYFTPDVILVTGPIWFNSGKINGDWKWSVQIDIGFKWLKKLTL